MNHTARPRSALPALPAQLALALLATTLAGPANAQPAPTPLPKVGACPSGYSTSGDYCLSTR